MASLNLKKLLKVMLKHDASDVYLTVDKPPAYRIDGRIKLAGEKALTSDDTFALAGYILNDHQLDEFTIKKEINVALKYDELGRFRANIFYQRNCVGLVIRRIKTQIPSIEELKLPKTLEDIIMRKSGLVIVSGAAGVGKSTSIAGMIDHRNRTQGGHIITVEDPIEYVYEHKKAIITQREVGTDTDSFDDALKNVLRQAPDVILIGEIRDIEAMEAALNYAETGHLCLATLHANNAPQTIERIMNFFPTEKQKQVYMQLSLVMQAIICQRLVPMKNGGRIPAVEILLNEPIILDLIKSGDVDRIKSAMTGMRAQDMQTFDEHLLDLYIERKIFKNTALKYADSENDLRLKIMLEEDGEKAEHVKMVARK